VWSVLITCCFVGYLFGSFPAGYFAGRLAGVDVRTVGSGNIGATNVLRVLGKKWGYPVFILDALKGLIPVRVALVLANQSPTTKPYAEYFAILAGLMAVGGHTFPVWLRFKGGKGVATSAGALIGLMPLAVPIIFLIWVMVFETTRYVSLASIIAAIALPIVASLFAFWKFVDTWALIYFTILIMLLVLWRHRSNFSRLLKGTEQRFTRK
jgi:glycerol-3-phosphate acyltransferase PlsY